ncbi:MAG: LacI family DNA-binding transcriptional regulator [Planctomycetota bacterium]
MTRVNTTTKRASVRDLAAKLGVSTATVSRALNNHPEVASDTRARVIEMARSVGYSLPTSPRHQNRTTTIGLVYPTDPVRPDQGSFESSMLSGVLAGVNEQRFDVMWLNLERDKSPEESYTAFFHRKNCAGVLVRSIVPNSTVAEEIAQEGFPFVLLADRCPHPAASFIESDSRADSMRAVEHLAHLGHERIALVVHAILDADHQDRRDGYLEGMRAVGLPVDDSLILRSVGTLDGGRQSIDRAMAMEDPPTAMYITTPPATLGALQRCLELGVRVPEDISIIGFDDSDTRLHAFPRYTSVCQDAQQMGFESARWLTRTLMGMSPGPLRDRRPTTFVIQNSTGIRPTHVLQLGPKGVERIQVGA